MERNVTETLGAGATVVMDPKRADAFFDNSIPMRNMHALEWLAYYIDPPQWPVSVFGAIDAKLAASGEVLFQKQCASCHEYGDDRRTASGLLRLRGMQPKDVGTDPVAALRISCPIPDPGPIDIPPRSYSAEDSTLLKDCRGVQAGAAFSGNSFAKVVQVAVGNVKRKAYMAEGIDPDQGRAMEDFGRRGEVAWRDTLLDSKSPYGPYAARPLYGIWAAAPYLHNGSVPTLYDLLLPPAQRPTKFALGARLYDPAKLGFAIATCDQPDCEVVTARPGDGNGGHVYGTDLSEAERKALLEYLKSY
jgi:hypothetical protein